MPEFLFDHSADIQQEILRADELYVFLDYDGTLVPFHDKPTDVQTPEKIKEVLHRLLAHPRIRVSIISGRPLQDLKHLLAGTEVPCAAVHGLHIESPDGSHFVWEPAQHAQPTLRAIKETMQKALKNETEAFLEDKELTVVLHYRLVSPSRVPALLETFRRVVQQKDTAQRLEIIDGAKVIEARPKGWNKGKAVEMLLSALTTHNRVLPIYIGDDITDEDAFEFLGPQGLTIHVTHNSKRKTAARYWVKDPEEVFLFLLFLLNTITHKE